MIKKVAVISLSRGLLGEPFVAHEVKIGMERLRNYGLEAVTAAHAMKGMDFLREHPQCRAQDLLDCLKDESVDMILCAVGGDDTYRLLPYLFDHDELQRAVEGRSTVFLGYSDSTMNHFMLHKAGLRTFYGQAFLPDVCELEADMLPYTKKYFEELINTRCIREIRPSDVWYSERKSFDASQIGVERERHKNSGFELLQGQPVFSGSILGGCIETIYDMLDNTRYADSAELCRRYALFPSQKEWEGKILLLESSEECSEPALYRKMLATLRKTGVFDAVSGVLVGKPMDEVYYREYRDILLEETGNPSLPIVYNVNVGHAAPHCIIPFGVECRVDVQKQLIAFA